MKILIAEDDEISRRLLVKILHFHGHCDAVADGALAVEAFQKAWADNEPYDLICLDIMMPVMDGQEALKQIRNAEQQMGITGNQLVKIIMLSALDDPRSVVEAFYSGGANAYLIKPLNKESLLLEIKNLTGTASEGQMEVI